MKKISTGATCKVNGIVFCISLYAAVSIDNDNGAVRIAAISTVPLDGSDESNIIYLNTDDAQINNVDAFHASFNLEQPVWGIIENRVYSMIQSGEFAEAPNVTPYDLEI